jgi:hypothetical protein
MAEDAERVLYELDPPQELPIVLQVLLSPAYRVRTLVLLRQFFDLGPSAVNFRHFPLRPEASPKPD